MSHLDNDTPLFEPSYEEHRHAQQLRWARETTAEQRLEWLEQALAFVQACGIDYLEQKRNLRGDPYANWDTPNLLSPPANEG